MKISKPKKVPLLTTRGRSKFTEFWEKLNRLEVGEMVEIYCERNEVNLVNSSLQYYRRSLGGERQYTLRTLEKGKETVLGVWRIK